MAELVHQHDRIVFFGVTGIDKRAIAEHVQSYIKNNFAKEFMIIDFEKECLSKSQYFKSFDSFLAKPGKDQAEMWNEAWEYLVKNILPEFANKAVILILHGVLVRHNFGVRSVVDLSKIISDFHPTLVINLIDDIYSMYSRTLNRANNRVDYPRPTLEQLLTGRKAEILISESLYFHISKNWPSRHIVFSVRNPIQSLINLIIFNANLLYLSFPITAPREAIANSQDYEIADAINNFHAKALSYMLKNSKLSIISPLSIDELPFVNCVDITSDSESTTVSFDPLQRWPIDKIWPGVETAAISNPTPIEVNNKDLQRVIGMIQADVAWRDFRLVSQSNFLAVFCPITKGRKKVARGVRAEIETAAFELIHSIVYQDSSWDTDNILDDIMGLGQQGTMGGSHLASWTTTVSSIEEQFDKINQLINQSEA